MDKRDLTNPYPPRRQLLSIGGRGRLLLLGGLLGACCFAVYLATATSKKPDPVHVVKTDLVDTRNFIPQPDILSQTKDETPTERALIEEKPLAHLLELALEITPPVAKSLRRGNETASVSNLRNKPSAFRGQFLSFKGHLRYFSKEQTKHPVYGYSVFRGRLEVTPDSGKQPEGKPPEQILFYVSKELPENLQTDDFVRIQGYFLKLKDEHLLSRSERAPVLVGREVHLAIPSWQPVTALDSQVLGRVQVLHQLDGVWVDGQGAEDNLEESEAPPLWHMASYARYRAKTMTEEERSATRFFENKPQLDDYRRGKAKQGSPIRIRGTLIKARVFQAESNPIGVSRWTEAWVQIPRMGGKLIPIWVARDASDNLELGRHDSVECYGYFFKNYAYTTRTDDTRFSPLFVTDDLKKFSIRTDPMDNMLGAVFVGLLLIAIVTIFLMVRGTSKESRKHEAALIERRKRRRSAEPTMQNG